MRARRRLEAIYIVSILRYRALIASSVGGYDLSLIGSQGAVSQSVRRSVGRSVGRSVVINQ